MTTRLVGTCPICERQQKVTPRGAMVHHGFRRPGIGNIVGDCDGVGWPAYELSADGCKAYRKRLAEWIAGQEDWLRRLRARPEEVDTYSQTTGKTKVFRRDSEDREEQYRYESVLKSKIQGAEYMISDLKRSDRRMVELIAKWAPAPLLEIDEEGLTPVKREERAARKTERDAKRAEKEQAQREHRAKVNVRLARKATALLFFFDEFERLAQQPTSTARNLYARDLLFEAAKKKHGIDYPWDLLHGPDDGYGNRISGPWSYELLDHAGDTLIGLDVAKREGNANRAYPFPVYGSSGNKIRVPEPNGPAEEVLDDIAQMRPPGSSSSSSSSSSV